MPIKLSNTLIALGTNQNFGSESLDLTLRNAVRALEDAGAVIRALSTFYKTPCFPIGAGPDYVNAALMMQVPWTPSQTLAHLHRIEKDFGRERIQRWGQRTLDLDLIAIEDLVAPNLEAYKEWRDLAPDLQQARAPTDLILPHPRLQDRAFVLVPLLEVANDWRHPVTALSVQQMLDVLPESEKAAVIPLNQ